MRRAGPTSSSATCAGCTSRTRSPSAVRGGAVRVGGARVRVDGNRVVIVDEGDGGLDLLRAACAAIWASGTAIHALDVPPRLYA